MLSLNYFISYIARGFHAIGDWEISDQILFYTAFVTALSVVVNLMLWKASVSQRRQSLMPFLVMYLRKDQASKDDYFAIRNLGYGPALNIKIENWRLYFIDIDQLFVTKFNLGIPNVLKVDEQRKIELIPTVNGKQSSKDFMTFVLNKGIEKVPISIVFQDLTGAWYIQKINLGKEGGLEIKKPPKRLRPFVNGMVSELFVLLLDVKIFYFRTRSFINKMRKK